MESLSKAYHFLRRNRRAIGLIAGASAAGLAMWQVKRVLDEYKRLIKEHDVARLDQHRYVHMCGLLWLLPCLRVGYGRVRKRGTD